MDLSETIRHRWERHAASQKSHRNPVVELARFVFSIMIMFWHARGYNGGGSPSFCGNMGYVAVEFFFLVSGYLLAAKVWHQRERLYIGSDTIRFLGGKLKGLMPVYLFALVGAIITKIVLNNLSFKEAMLQIILSIYDSLLLRMSGVRFVQFVGGAWYISAMLIGGVILYSLYRRFGDVFSNLIAPVGAIFLLGYLFNNYSNLNLNVDQFKIFAPGLLRALAEMSIGCITFRIAGWLKEKRLTRFSAICLSIINLGCIVIVFIGATTSLHKRFDYIMLALLAISVTIMFSEQSLYFRCKKKPIDRLMVFLGSLSLPMYLTHIWIKSIIIANTKEWPRQKGLILYFVSVIAFSLLSLWLIRMWKAFLRKNGYKIKRIFIADAPQK